MIQIQIKFRKGNDMNRIQKICITFLFMISVLLVGICCGSKVQAKNSAPETAYQEFLEGRRMLHIDDEALESLKEIGRLTHLECGALSMKRLLKEINTDYYEDFRGKDRIACIEYAYLDCGKDGSRELAVRFDSKNYRGFQLIFIITFEDGALYLRHAMETWDRNLVLLNQYGYIWETGYDSAVDIIKNETFVDGSGKTWDIAENHLYWSDIHEPEICQQVYGTEEYFFEQNYFQIDNKEYRCLFDQEGEDPVDENFIQFKKLYEQKHGKLYTKAEIEKLLDKRRKELGITKEMSEESDLDWNTVETAEFKELVSEIGLNEAYDQIELGDWSDIQNFDELQTPINVNDMSWMRRDLNYDGTPELLCLNQESIGNHMPIRFIFTYLNNKAEIVFTDQKNDSEYYFLGENGNLICDYGSYAAGKYHSISRYLFNEDWELKKRERLEVSCEVDGNKISCFKEKPLIKDALSQDGAGEEWNVIPISANVFLEEYQWMTGEDFLEKGNDWEQLFKNAGNAVSDSGFSYGKWEPDLAENEFVKAVKKCGDFKENCSSLTYAADYDNDGGMEAFVVMGRNYIYEGEQNFAGKGLWFVNSQYEAVEINVSFTDIPMTQQYIRKEDRIYLLFQYCIGIPWETPIYIVKNNQAVCIEESLSYTYKYINKYGQIMVEQDAYDHFYGGICEDSGEPFSFWTGHTWKYYPFRLTDDRLLEMGARELSAEAVEDISPLPISLQEDLRGDEEHPIVGVQYLLRDNGDLNINYVSGNSYDTDELDFNNVTLRLNETNQWMVSDYNGGTYMINFSEGKKWTFLENLDRKLELKLCSK